MAKDKLLKKKLCDWKKKNIEHNFKEYCSVVTPVKSICTKCGRAASSKKNLCKPAEL